MLRALGKSWGSVGRTVGSVVTVPSQHISRWEEGVEMTTNRYLTASLSLSDASAELAGADVSEFAASFSSLITSLTTSGIRSVLVSIPGSHARLVEGVLGHEAFALHHVDPEANTVVLGAWLEEGHSRLPEYATHSVGCGGLVLGPDESILVVREHGDLRKASDGSEGVGQWKLPGGAADLGEDLPSAAVREVWEETGVETEPIGLIALRQAHGFRFGRSDLYFVFALAPVNGVDIDRCRDEIYDAKWMGVREYADLPLSPMNQSVADSVVASLDKGKLRAWDVINLRYRGRESVMMRA